MKAMVLAAGFGSRLKELTKDTPKCLVPLADGSTMLAVVINRLKKTGVTEVVINTHYLADRIKEYLVLHDNFQLSISFSHEPVILGTGGGLKNAASFFKNDPRPFFLHNSDVWCDTDLKVLYDSHCSSGVLVTLAVTKRETKRPLYFTKDLKLSVNATGTTSNPHDVPFGFSGIQVISTKFFSYLEKYDGEFSTIPVFQSAVAAGEIIRGFDISADTWIDMGTPELLARVNAIVGSA